jgi:Cu-processing system permease protein
MQWQVNINRLWCLIRFELVRVFSTKRGIFALAAFASVWLLILYYGISSAASLLTSSNFKDMAQQAFGALGLSQLLTWKVPELSVYWLVAAYFFPVYALYSASDQTCSDRTRGTLRFICLRASRSEIVLGRFLGQLLIVMSLIVLTLLATVLMAVFRDTELLLPALARAGSLLPDLLFVVLPFIALMSFFNSFMRSSRLVLVMATLFFTFLPLLIALLGSWFHDINVLNYIIPGVKLGDVADQQQSIGIRYLLPFLQTITYLALTDVIMKRSTL